MFKNVKAISTERVDLSSEQGWLVRLEVDNPKYPEFDQNERAMLLHTIPDSAILWRAAELETEDIDQVLDVLLTENYIKERNPPTFQEHKSRCAAMKLSMRLSTRENKSVLRARAANPDDPMTASQAEEPHPLAPIRSERESLLPQAKLEHCRRQLAQMKQEAR